MASALWEQRLTLPACSLESFSITTDSSRRLTFAVTKVEIRVSECEDLPQSRHKGPKTSTKLLIFAPKMNVFLVFHSALATTSHHDPAMSPLATIHRLTFITALSQLTQTE